LLSPDSVSLLFARALTRLDVSGRAVVALGANRVANPAGLGVSLVLRTL